VLPGAPRSATALVAARPVMAVVAADLVTSWKRVPRKSLCGEDLGEGGPLERRAVTIGTSGRAIAGAVRMGTHPSLPHRAPSVWPAIVGGGKATAMAKRTFRYSACIALQIGAVHVVVGLVRRILSVL